MLQTEANSGFYGLGIAPKLLRILDSLGFKNPTPIQEQSIPHALEGKDILGVAQTGTGKTLAFGLPMIQRLAQSKGMGLVVLPTRELALQVEEALHKIGKPLGLKTAVLIGGESIHKQLTQLKRKPHIIIATPGRLLDHLDQKTVRLDTVTILVLDEADRMLDMGFAPQIKKILSTVPKERQTLLFSATMPVEITKLAVQFMQLPIRVEVAPAGTTAKRITQEVFFVPKPSKPSLLHQVLQEYQGSVLVFSRTKFGAKKIAHIIRQFSISATEIHSNRSLNQRLEALAGFKRGKYRVLVATDIAARGIDVTGIEVVINYDLPDNPEDYVHRIGRTGRADKAGHAISFATPEQRRDVKDIERLIRTQLPISELPTLAAIKVDQGEPERPERRGMRGARGRSSSAPQKSRFSNSRRSGGRGGRW
jgi:ATP-dependent RNA helicase RhlE